MTGPSLHRPEPRDPGRTSERGGCGDDCRYFDLYLSSQSSLADMAENQASALRRHANLKTGIVVVLKQMLPAQFAALEHHLASRLGDVDDDALLTYMAYLLETAVVDGRIIGASLVGADDLRDALETVGYELPAGEDLAGWAAAITTDARHQPDPSPDTGTPIDPAVDPAQIPSPPAGSSPAGVMGANWDRWAAAAEAGEWPDPWPDPNRAGAAGWDRGDTGLPAATPETGWQAKPVRTLATITAQKEGLFDKPGVPEPVPWPNPVTGGAPIVPNPPADPDVSEDTASNGARTEQAGPSPAGEGQAEPVSPTPPSPPATQTPENGVATFSGPAGVGTKPEPKPVRPPALRPELFPTAPGVPKPGGKRRVSRRAPTVTAAAPQLNPADTPHEPGGAVTAASGLSGDIRTKLFAAVSIPKPVFTSDLAETFTSGVVEMWETECRSTPTSGVRFVAPKPRHRRLGSLVVPVSAARTNAELVQRNGWTRSLDLHKKGAKLYELAVLFHAIGKDVVTHQVHEHLETVQLRASTRRGTVGVVVVTGTHTKAGGSTIEAIVDDLMELSAGNIELLAVLSTHDPSFDDTRTHVVAEASRRGWQPSCPVIAARSWEYAAGTTSAYQHLLG